MKRFLSKIGLIFCFSGVACAQVYDPLNGTGAVTRTNLTYNTLIGTTANLVDYSAYAVPANAANPDSIFQGTLTLNNVATTGSFATVKSSTGYVDPGHLPAFSYQFVQHGTHILPIQRGLFSLIR